MIVEVQKALSFVFNTALPDSSDVNKLGIAGTAVEREGGSDSLCYDWSGGPSRQYEGMMCRCF